MLNVGASMDREFTVTMIPKHVISSDTVTMGKTSKDQDPLPVTLYGRAI